MNKLICWNVRGFNQPFKRRELKELISVNKIGFCGILETHVAKDRVDKVFNSMFRKWSWTSNSIHSKKGCRIVIGWDPSQFVTFMFSEEQVIHCVVQQVSDGRFFHCSVVYAANDHIPRRKLWHSLEMYAQLVGSTPWMMLGDFNAILQNSESEGGVLGRSPAISEFRGCVSKLEVMDLHYDGIQFTWSGSPHGVGVVKKLDRVLVNASFLSKFRGAKCKFLPRGTSDHSPALVEFGEYQLKKRSAFKFQKFLAFRSNFADLVDTNWRCNSGGVRMFQLVKNLKNLKPVLRDAAWEAGNLTVKVDDLKTNLQSIQNDLDKDPFNDALKDSEMRCLREYREAMLEEERM